MESRQRVCTMLLPTLLCCLLLSAFATAFKNCINDCVKITECASAVRLVRTDRSPAATKQIQDAVCGYDGLPKVCCSDFISSRSLNAENDNTNTPQTSGDEIVNHRNLHLLPTDCGDIEGDKIVGGVSAGLYEFPWLALIAYKDTNDTALRFKCGGTVITSRYVLTAAHCIVNKSIASVRIGDYDISQSEDCVGQDEMRECQSKYQDIPVSHQLYHPRYTKIPYILNDIGLLRLARPVDFSVRNAGTICLPISKELLDKDLAGEIGVVAGWGMVNTTTKSNILLKVDLPIFSKTACNTYYKSPLRPGNIDRMTNTFCAGELGHDSCKGDSGGPLMLQSYIHNTYKYVQYGVVSYGPRLCGSEKPGVYTDVSKFMKWILDTIKP